ncbi:MAG: hypothetical protein NVS4B3_18540 [Gemmatimonadaceae bacterium]
MTDAELWAAWRLWMGVATVIILVAAGLLIVIWRTARGIHSEAVRALRAAERIRASTAPIWALATTNEVATEMLTTVRHIEQTGGALAAALESHAGAR